MTEPMEPAFEVVSPLGRRGGLPPAELAGRVPDLAGRTVALVWDHVFSGDVVFERFAREVARRHPDARFVGHEAFGNIHGTTDEEHDAVAELPRRLREHGVDAVVVGVGA